MQHLTTLLPDVATSCVERAVQMHATFSSFSTLVDVYVSQAPGTQMQQVDLLRML